jgi:hypothetical protein
MVDDMNERIRQLAEQAGIHFGRSATLDGNNIARFVTTSDMEKFAELIVNQCADIAQQHNKSPVAAPLAIGYVIREHFGVAE